VFFIRKFYFYDNEVSIADILYYNSFICYSSWGAKVLRKRQNFEVNFKEFLDDFLIIRPAEIVSASIRVALRVDNFHS